MDRYQKTKTHLQISFSCSFDPSSCVLLEFVAKGQSHQRHCLDLYPLGFSHHQGLDLAQVNLIDPCRTQQP